MTLAATARVNTYYRGKLMCVAVWALFFYVSLKQRNWGGYHRCVFPGCLCHLILVYFLFLFSHVIVCLQLHFKTLHRAWSVDCNALVWNAMRLVRILISAVYKQPVFIFCFLSSTFWGILWRLARGIVLLLNVKWSVGTFENCVKLCLKRTIFYAASYLYCVKRGHCHTLSV